MEFPKFCKNNNAKMSCGNCSCQCHMCDECDDDCHACPHVCEAFSYGRGGHPSTPNPCEGFYRNNKNYPIGYDCTGCPMLPMGW